MSDFKVFDGGNKGAYPWDNIKVSDYVGGYPIKYAAHLTDRHKVMPFHIDFGNPEWQTFLKDVTGGQLMGTDRLGTHLLAAGTEIEGFAIQIRQPSNVSGMDVGVMLELADGSTVSTTPTDATTAGFYWVPELDNLRLQQAAIAYVYYTGADAENVAASGLCMSATPSLIAYASEYHCKCLPAPCDADYPDPLCSPYSIAGGGEAPPAPEPPTEPPVAGFTFEYDACGESPLHPVVWFTNTSTGAQSYSWDVGGGMPSTTETSPRVDYPASVYDTVITVTLTAYSGPNQTGDSDTRTVTITLTACG